jgi:hypothetical protein
VLLGGGSRCRVRTRERGCGPQPLDESILVHGIDEHARLRWHELGRAADPRRDHRAADSHRLEHGLAERLDQTRLHHDVRGGDLGGNTVVGNSPDELDPGPALELWTQRAVADERERPFAEPLERGS